MERKKKTRREARARPVTKVKAHQWKLPAGYMADGKRLATLRDVMDPNTPTMSLGQLTDRQRLDLVAKRIEMQPDFEIATLGAGLIDQKRAIQEVKAGTRIGRNLAEIEQRLISHLVQSARRGR